MLFDYYVINIIRHFQLKISNESLFLYLHRTHFDIHLVTKGY